MAIRAEGGDIGVAKAAGTALVEGARIKGKVTGVERYGVFVQIAGSQGRSGRGLIPGPETGTPRGSDLKKHFSAGQDVEAKSSASTRPAKSASPSPPWAPTTSAASSKRSSRRRARRPHMPQAPRPRRGRRRIRAEDKPAPRGFGTLADLLPKGVPVAPEPKAAAAKAPTKRAAPAGAAPAGAAGKRTKR